MQFRNPGQQNMNNNRNRGDYEIRTFTGNQRNRSPIQQYAQNYRRSPMRIYEQGSESAMGEMIYLEPNETHFQRGQNMSPLNDSRNMIMRSPIQQGIRNEYGNGGIVNMSQHYNYMQNQRVQQRNNDMERREVLSRSPKTINAGESPQEVEYNVKTLNSGRMNNMNMNMNSPKPNFLNDRSYNMMSNETGNIFLEQNMPQGGYIVQNDASSSGILQQGMTEQRGMEQNNREIQFVMNPRDLQEPLPGVLRKMSPKGNVEGDSDSVSEKNDNINQIKDLKSQLERNNNQILNNDDGIGMGEMNRQNRGDMENIEMMARTGGFQDNVNVTGDEVKKLIKYYVKTYDPHKGEDGNLISNMQMIIPSNQDKLFTDRYKVLQKMNKLSSILLAKRNGSPDSYLNRSLGEDKKKFDKNTLNNATIRPGAKKTLRNKGKNKFLYVSLAMLSAKGPNTEDRTILRRMRIDKGGVVDLAQENIQKKNRFRIKKARISGRGFSAINPKYRDKAARIVQSWWRERKERYKKILEQIIKIQSVWRGKFTRKYVYDIIYISYLQEKFFAIMRNVLVNHIRPYVFNELFSKNKLIKDTLGDLLSKYDKKFTLIRLKPYFLKWRNSSEILTQRLLVSKSLVEKKEYDEKKLSLLKKYFDKWSLISNLYKYIGKAKNAEEKRQKFFGTLNMINGLTSLTKRQIHKVTKEPITNYLKDLLKQKILSKITNNIRKKCLDNILRKALYKWHLASHTKKLDDLKADTFIKAINHIDSRLDKIKMKYYLDRWHNQIPKYKKLANINKGLDLLNRYSRLQTYKDPLKIYLDKCDEINKKNALGKLINIKKRNLKDLLKKAFDIWKNKRIRLDDKDKRNDIYNTLLKNIINKIEKRILQKKFNKWRQRPKIDLNDEFRKMALFNDKLYNIYKTHFLDDYITFIERLYKTRSERTLRKAGKNIYKIYKKKNTILLKYYLYKWRSKIKDEEIKELHKQLLRYIITTLETKSERNTLAKYFTRWRLFVGDGKNYDNLEKLKLVLKGGEILGNIYHRRLRDLFNRLNQKMRKDYRPLLIGKLIKKLEEPRTSLRECFNRWRRLCEKEQEYTNINNYKAKIIDINVKTVKNRNDREKLMKAFFHWRAMSKKPEEYYPKINNLLNTIAKNVKKASTEEPFDKIKKTINPNRYLQKLIKNYKNQEQRNLDNKLRNLFGRWRKKISDKNAKDLKAKILYNLKIYLNENDKKKLLSKYLTKWRYAIRKKDLDVNFIKGIDKITEVFKSSSRKIIYDLFKNKINKVSKSNAAKDLFKAVDKNKKNLLHIYFLKWWKKSIKIDPNRITKIKTKIRRIIKYNETEPLAKAFHRWNNQIQLMKLKEKDIYHAAKTIYAALRNNDKMNLNNAMSKWKKQIQRIREQYLKSLLVKQIKTSQNVKEKMNNEARLRAALLKWRANLISLDYLNKIKQIRKGCKIFKLGLKKMHEKDILDKINDLAKHNKKKNLLKNIINRIIPNLQQYQQKRALDIWKSKLGDTAKMKNKIKQLFEDYIYSDHVHDGLFKQPKDDIINMFKLYNNKRNDAINKIIKFVKKIQEIPEHIRKMKANILLASILRNKDKQLNDIKKMYFIKYYRQVQKDKNNENAKIIQKFIKDKLRKYLDKKKLIKNGADKLTYIIKKICFYKINDEVEKKNILNCLRKAVNLGDKYKNDILKEKLKQWRDIVPKMDKLDKITQIQNAFRTHKANNKLNKLKLREKLLIKIEINYANKNNKILDKYFHDWLRKALIKRNNDNARIIQKFCRDKMNSLKDRLAKDKLRNLLHKNYIHKLSNIMKKISRISGGKGDLVYKTIQDLIKNRFDKFINNLKSKGNENTLRKIQPKIHDKISKYYLDKTLKKWKENTYDKTLKHTINLQNFLRHQYAKKMKRDKIRRELLLGQIMDRLTKNNLYKLLLPFNIWHKKTLLDKMNSGATKIQNKWRQVISKQKAKDLNTANKYLNLVKMIKTKNLLDIISKIKKDKVKKTKTTKILTTILSKQIFINDKSNLEYYFNKWRRINQLMNNNVTKIANAYRTFRAKKEIERLKNINEFLKKYIQKKDKTNDDILRSKLRKWYNKVKLITYNENSRIIQRFIKPKLYKLINDKIKQFFIKNSKRKVDKYILLAVKLNKLYKAINKPKLNKFLNNLKTISDTENKKDNLGKTINDINDRNKLFLLKTYLQKWLNNSYKLNEIINDEVSSIQRAFKIYKANKEKNRLMTIKKILTITLIKKEKASNNKLYSAFMKWLNIARTIQCNTNAKIIQQFCRDVLDKIQMNKDILKQQKIKDGLDILNNIKFGARYALDKINSEKNRNIFESFNNMLKNKRADILKDCFDRIKQQRKDNVLRNVINNQDNFETRILKKWLDTWKQKADKLGKKRAVEIIYKNWKIYLNNIREKNKGQILKKILSGIILKNSDALRKYFNKWRNYNNYMKLDQSKLRIAKYIKKRFRIANARENWNKLANKLKLKDDNKNLIDIIKTLNTFNKLNKFIKPFTSLSRKKFLDKVKYNKKRTLISKTMIKLIPKTDNKYNTLLLKNALNNWRDKVNKLNDRENKMNEALDLINKKQKLNDIATLDNVFTIKKLFHDLPYIRAKQFFEKIKQKADKRNKYDKLKEDLNKARIEIEEQNKLNLMNTLYKIYFYNKLDNLFKTCNKYNDKMKNIFGRELLYKLLKIKTDNSVFNYNNKISNEIEPKKTKLSFKNKSTKNKTIASDKNAPMRKVLPNVVNYLDSLIKRRNRDTYDKIRANYINNKFCQLLKSFNDKIILPDKDEFIQKIKRDAKYAESRPIYQMKLFKLMRKKFIRTIITTLVEPSRIYRQFYLINITKMHKNIAQQRFYRELIRKWRFITFTKKMARKKLELMYKNLHASYLQMADEIFGDENNINPSVFKEFERFGTNVGMFTGQEPEIDEELNKKYYSTVDKKYVFTTKASMTLPTVKSIIKTETEEYEEEIVEGKQKDDVKRAASQNVGNLYKNNKDNKKGGFASKYYNKNKK